MNNNDSYYEDEVQHYSHLGPSQSIKQSLTIIIDYIISDIKKKPRSFKIGLFTIYLVVTFLALIQSAFALSPLIFIQLAETQTGDADVTFTPVAAENRTQNSGLQFGPQNRTQLEEMGNQLNGFSMVNSTQVDEVTSEFGSIFGQSPRWLIIGDLLNNRTDRIMISQSVRSFILIIDSIKENSIGLGRRLDSEILVNDEIMVTESGLRGLNASVGDVLQLNLDLIDFLGTYMLGSTESGDGNQFFINIFDQTINPYLKAIYGDDILEREFNTTDLRNGADELVTQADFLEQHPEIKSAAKTTVENQIRQYNLSDSQQQQLLDVTEFFFDRNLSQDARAIQNFTKDIQSNETVTLTEIEGGFADILVESFNFVFNVTVKQGVQSSKGKWTDGLGNVVVMDQSNATQIITQAFLKRFEEVVIDYRTNDNTIVGAVAELIPIQDVKDFVNNNTQDIDLEEYALTSNLIYNNRVDRYADKYSVKDSVISFTNQFFAKMGYDYPASATVPLADTIQQFFLLKNFIDNLIVSATFLLLMLSVLLIYSLMIGDVEEKTYEFGMLRALGFKKVWLITLLMIQAMTFALPGLFLGLITCYILNSLIAMFIFDSSYLVSSYDVAPSAIGLAFGLGICIPLASNILPITRALSKTLRDSLDLYHRTVNDIYVTVVKLEKMGVSIEQTFSAALLVIMGFISYYLVPMAFIFSNMQLALAIINIILIIMIIGFTLLVNLLESPFEKCWLYLMLFIYRKDSNLKPIILKNMEGHKSRNSKTTLMYTIALAFLIFSGAGFALQTEVIGDVLQSTLGADITVYTLPTDEYGLDEYNIRLFLNETKERDPTLISEYSFSTYQMNSIATIPKHIYISTLARFPWKKIRITGVEENYLRSCMDQFYIPNKYDESISWPLLSNGKKDGINGLYNREGNIDLVESVDYKNVVGNSLMRQTWYSDLNETRPGSSNLIDREINIVIPEGYKYEAAIEVDTPSLLFVGGYIYRLKVRHMATKIPGFRFSSYRSITSYGDALISLEDMLFILNDYYRGNVQELNISDSIAKAYFEQLPEKLSFGLPKDGLTIKFGRSTSLQERIDFSNGLRNYFRNEQTLLFDAIEMRQDAEDTFFFITLFYIIVAIVAMTLSFFLILVSFVSNVKDNSWEFGVLRAVGLNKGQITRIYIYEAVSLIMSSGLLGTIVGLVVAITLTLQILMFTELPFKFVFPTEIFLLTFLGGFFTALGASYLAVLELRDKSISTILKGLL